MPIEPDKEKDSPNRYPSPPKIPLDVLNDPIKRKQWNEYWQRAKEEWSEFLKEDKRRGEFNDSSGEAIRKYYRDNRDEDE